MNHAALMRVAQRPRHFLQQLHREARRERAGPLHPVAQCLAVHEAHHEEHQLTTCLDEVNRHNIGMREASGGPRLLQEAVPLGGLRREVRREQLDRDRAVERHITGEQHDPHTASPELALDRIAAGEQLLEGQEFGADRRAHVPVILRVEPRCVSSRPRMRA